MGASVAQSIHEFLEQNATKDLLRFSTVGSVDDGKSTLIGRLLHDTKSIYEDHLHALKADSARIGTGPELDFALLTDGLKAEREQKITIDVAYRYFSTPKRNFIIADTPGHEQYTRNMATGASTANLAIILIDARHGILTQTKRHSFIASLLGIPRFLIAVNKMDLVGYAQAVFDRLVADYRDFATRHPVAAKRALRAILKAVQVCAIDPPRAARAYLDRGFNVREDHVLQALRELPYARWREYDPMDTLRFYALRLHEAGMIKSSPQKIFSQGTDWRFLNELRKELKG